MKFLIDEDLSPRVARYLCEQFCIDAIAVRDRGWLGATDREVLDYALTEDRILVTANIRDISIGNRVIKSITTPIFPANCPTGTLSKLFIF